MASSRSPHRVSLDNNELRQIDNPLNHLRPSQLKKLARDFAESIGADKALFEKAAEIANDPLSWKKVDVTKEESTALEEEKKQGFWLQPKPLRVSVVTLCFSAIVQGWIQAVSNGANQTLPLAMGLKDKHNEWKGKDPVWKFASINAITYLAAAMFGCWCSDPLQSWLLGRRGAIFASACICLMAAIGAATAQTWQESLIWRAVLGLGIGAKASVTPIFGAEISPSHLRGTLVMNWQLFDAFGIFCGFTANLIVSWTGNLSWRFQLASACIPAGCLMTLIWTIPESPRWLLRRGKGDEAFRTLCALRPTPLQAATELFYANAQLQTEVALFHRERQDTEEAPRAGASNNDGDSTHDVIQTSAFQDYWKRTNYWTRIYRLFRNARSRRAAIAASVVMLSQQLCGVNAIMFYSTTFFRDVDGPNNKGIPNNKAALWLSWGVGLANFVFTFPAYWWIDSRGRRFLLLATYPGMIISMLGACLSFLTTSDAGKEARVGVFMMLFILFYSIGQGPVAFTYASEVFPLFCREAGMSLAVFVNLFGAGLLTLFVPQAQVASHGPPEDRARSWDKNQQRLLGAFVGCNVIALLLIFFLVPETAGASVSKEHGKLNYMSLEELNYIFGVPTAKHIQYQVRHVLPWAVDMVKYQFGRLWRKKGEGVEKPYIEKMYYWVAVKEAESEESQERSGSTEETKEAEQEHREVADGPNQVSGALDSIDIDSRGISGGPWE
ncbi:hypothetical protein H2200_009721 [Cladophialophora chaetospira]|uniref:Major facilitator superfamily (MFS) profile domain-containing protein n=1 Tax=Cladophialophora chaetospira TaxID=386627 RepID=A0AA39CF52_9EURO|nr:hypothetical protein H2200_009721 [Cladophialophora chaetospira]